MKKCSILVALVMLMSVLLCGCGKFECDICGEEKSGKKYKDEVFGQEVEYCKDCKEDLEDLGDLFN